MIFPSRDLTKVIGNVCFLNVSISGYRACSGVRSGSAEIDENDVNEALDAGADEGITRQSVIA